MHTRRHALRALAAAGVGLAAPKELTLAAQPSVSTELLIRNGRIVNADAVVQGDVRVVGETIAEVASGLRPGRAERVIDASGKLIMPGGVDPHTHLDSPFVDDVTSGSRAALAGGVTTVGTFVTAQQGETLATAIERMTRRIRKDAIADVFLHASAWPPSSEITAAMKMLADLGQPSFKVFLQIPDFGAHLPILIRQLEAAREAGVVTMVHCEDGALLAATARRLQAEGRTSLEHYAASRPVIAEVAATQQVAALCESIGSPLYVVHISAARALDACRPPRRARAPLFVETRSLYLHLTIDRMRGPEAPMYVAQPPLREETDRQALWRGLADGSIDVLATDHAPWTREQKLDPALSITRLRPGMSDLQFMLPMYFSEGVQNRHLLLTRFVATTSTNAARIFGLYPRKGVIRPGSDADIVIWDPKRTGSVTADADLSNADYSVYEGKRVTGWPITTIRRGEIVFDAGRVSDRAGTGRLVARERWRG